MFRRSLRWLVLATVFGACALGPLATDASADARRVDISALDISDTDLEVFMAVDAPAARIRAVERALLREASVRRFALVDQQHAYREFAQIFEDKPALVKSTKQADLPVSFRVDTRRDVDPEAIATRLRGLPGVDSVELPGNDFTEADALQVIEACQAKDPNFEVFMRMDASPEQVDAVVAAVAATPGLKVEQVVSREEAYRELQQVNPQVAREITPAELPESIRAAPAAFVADDTLVALGGLPGVDSVESPRQVCVEVRTLLDEGWAPSDLARAFIALGGRLPS